MYSLIFARKMAKGKGRFSKPPRAAPRSTEDTSNNSEILNPDGYEPEPLFYGEEEKILAFLVR